MNSDELALAAGEIPNPHGFIEGHRSQLPTIWREGNTLHPSKMTAQDFTRPVAVKIPECDGSIAAARRCQRRAIWRDIHCREVALLSKRVEETAGIVVDHTNCAFLA